MSKRKRIDLVDPPVPVSAHIPLSLRVWMQEYAMERKMSLTELVVRALRRYQAERRRNHRGEESKPLDS